MTENPASNSSRNSTFVSSTVPYYGSREPKQSIIETDRVIFQMMDDIQIKSTSKDTEKPEENRPQISIMWRFRIIFCSILILLLVVGTFPIYIYYVTLILLH
jgi:hypothetical protein